MKLSGPDQNSVDVFLKNMKNFTKKYDFIVFVLSCYDDVYDSFTIFIFYFSFTKCLEFRRDVEFC